MKEKYVPLQRSLSLLRRLQRGPADKETLVDFVSIDFASDAYADDGSTRSRRLFENDLLRLRELGMDYEHERKSGEYSFRTFGSFSPLCLTDAELATVAFLAESFQGDAPNSAGVQQLLRRILDLLPANQQEEVVGRRQRLRMDLQRRSTQAIPRKVQTAIERTVGRQQLRFAYLSPNQADAAARIHTVEPWEYVFDTARGHYYLEAYRRSVEGPYGLWKEGQWQRYRPERIDPASVQVLPDRLPPTPPKRPRHPLEYWLAPEIARLGQITRHFGDMAIHETDGEGWVRVTATTDNLFLAVRQLLHYGPNCRVTGDAEARREMATLVAKMAEAYES
ncbi:MAG: WYL domain-containing protein [Caldilineaceae bacterium]|nr:WYL domain-containing protein [Caldilineaceae bacterium]